MRLSEFGIKDLFRAATGDWPGDAAMARELAKVCSKASPGDILKMVKKAKQMKQRGLEVDIPALCGNLLDPQVQKKMDLKSKFSPQDIQRNRDKQDLLRRQRKKPKKQQQKKVSPVDTDRENKIAQEPPQNAKLQTKSFGDLVWNGTEWVGPGGLRFSKPDDIKKMHQLYFKVQDANNNLETAKRDAENEKLRLQAYQKVFGMNRK